ncbi:PorP/SprF family type IX secretion system membrane protein [Flavisolibacter ginsengisoli]|jgi:type IX secretion system PorP/SprF family membrane protein|uniref:Type IX secretion system membrane protein, PorP/SprF family n=1 Tax=Flavisolibacter ginsengisoli DSM 18119 TaxID=1121884 RepID=A0A1M5EXL6_9BACT|nr:PorP/SprF family type IX secretion system membrane protein [Flavisolibacter ginsengisoli]SHF83781.1 type IX secretion system membrane protein, PorP/SprF family [Flavisolibacter ginsengisoli DSM 18119]
MRKKLYHIIFSLLTLCCNALVSGQDIHFSQFFEAPLLRNPSLAGIFTGDIRIQTVYRDQWNSLTDAFKTFSLNGEYKMPVGKGSDFLTTGLQILHDRAGTVSWVSTHVLPALNFHKSLSNDKNRYLSLGFMGGFVQRSFDRSKMTTNSQYDGMGDGEIFLKPLYSYLDVSVGMSYNSQIGENPNNNFFVGAAYHHLNKPKNSFYRNASAELEPKWVGSAGVRLAVTPISYLTIQADHSRQGQFMETVGGALYGIKIGDDWDKPLYTIHGGAFLRWNDALIPVIKLDYAPFSASFSYDINLSKLKTSSYGRGGFELSISYIGFINREIESLNCPRF